jgi:hypothetical protein
MENAFKRAEALGALVLLWGRTLNPDIEIVMLKWPAGQTPYSVCCFDRTNGGFYNCDTARVYRDGQQAFMQKLNRVGGCD